MGKVLKIGLAVAGIAVAFVPGVGPAITGAIYGLTGGAVGAAAATVLAVGQAVTAGLGALGIATAVGMAGKALGLGPKTPKVNRETIGRLTASVDPSAPRKVVFGRTAMATDIRYQAFTGTDKEYYHQIVCVASHTAEAIDELWLDDKLAWSSSSGIGADFTGYLTVTSVLAGTSGNIVSIDSTWGPASNTRLTGCAYLHIRYKLTGNSKKVESPFAQSVPTRMTIVGKGMKVYDPRRDTTVGGSGSHRADDQSTWAYSVGGDDIGRNPALQTLTWLLGWKINNNLAVGRGVSPDRIDLDSFMAAANLCEEDVALAAGGTELRYRFDGIFAEDEDGGSILTTFMASMNGVLRDNGGKLGLSVLYNDLASPVMSFTEADVIGPFDWQQTQPLESHRNVVRGRYVDPSNNSLYQLVDYPQVSIASPDGLDRILTMDLPGVQSASQAQRLAKQALQRLQYGGLFRAEFNARGWGVLVGDPVELTFSPLGWTDKLFRVVERTIRPDGVCAMTLAEEDADLYAWDAEEAPPVVPANPVDYDWTKHPLIQANIEDNADVTLRITGAAKSTVACDYTGAPKTGQLTKTLTFALLRGTAETDETANATWSCSIAPSGAGTVANNAIAGKVDLSVLNVDRAEITVEATYATSTRTFVHVVEKLIDAAPIGGGGGGGSSASDSSINNTTSSSYGSANAGTLTVTAGASGIVDLSFPGSFTRTTNGIGSASGKWQWSAAGAGTWADVATEIASTSDSFTNTSDGTYDAGSIFVNQQKTGLTPATSYDFRLLLRNGGTYTQNWTGTASAVGS